MPKRRRLQDGEVCEEDPDGENVPSQEIPSQGDPVIPDTGRSGDAMHLPRRRRRRRLSEEDGVEDDAGASGGSHQSLVKGHGRWAEAGSRDSGARWTGFPGAIRKVVMTNFMCHSRLEYCPTESINFLHGSNGSGKSAVLSAIVFGLGGTARMSNRGTSNKGFVKTGCSQATVEVTLANQGEDAYRPDLYGDTITIVRSVSSGTSGASSYKLKNSAGRIVCDRKVKEELDRILEAFSVQVDNPITILNQDAAKTFLFKCDPGKLYDFFMRATQLADCKKDYATATEEKNSAEILVSEKRDALPTLKAEVSKWEKKYQFFKALKNQKETTIKLKAELAWAMLKQAELELEKAQAEEAAMVKKVDKVKEKVEADEAGRETLRREKAEVEAEIEVLAKETETSRRDMDGHKENLRAAKEDLKKAERVLSELDRKIRTKNGELGALGSAIAAAAMEAANGAGDAAGEAALQGRQQRLEALEREKDELEAQIQSTQAHMANLAHSAGVASTRDRELRAAVVSRSNDMKLKEKELDNLKKQGDNKLVLFGDKMPNFVREIERNADRFRVKPLGPLGSLIKLSAAAASASGKEAKLIETELGQGLLRSFLVDNFEDKRTLDQIASGCRMGNSVPIITSKFSDRVHDVSRGRCGGGGEGGQQQEWRTIYDMLEFEDPNAANCLIDHKRIEQVLVLERDSEAQRLLKSAATVPPNCAYALTLSGFNQYYPAPSYRSYAMDMGRGGASSGRARILQVSVDELEQELLDDLERLRNEADDLRSKVAENKERLAEHERERAHCETTCKSVRSKIAAAVAEMNELRVEAEAEKPPDLAALEEDKERLQEEIEELNKVRREQGVVELEAAEAEVAKFSERLEEKRAKLQALASGRSDPLRERLEEIEAELDRRATHLDRFAAKLSGEFRERLAELAESTRRKAAKVDDQRERSARFPRPPADDVEGEEPSPTRTRKPEAIFRDLQILEESIRRQEEVREPEAEVVERLRTSRKVYGKAFEQIESLKETVRRLEELLKQRRRCFYDIRGSISRRISNNFSIRLKARNFAGFLDFDHKSQELHIRVDPAAGPEVDGPRVAAAGATMRTRDMKTLSGGEKSYSTVALVLSLWDNIRPPFRILDEFDVFMDSLNRKIALDQIITYIRSSRKYQYVFLTPLSLDGVLSKDKDDIRVIYFEKNN